MTTRTFDRIPSRDRRSLLYPMSAVQGPKLRPRSREWKYYQTDQGSEGACVGHATTQEAAAHPKPFFGERPTMKKLNSLAHETYKRAQELDEWAGENYDGTSVLAGMKVGVEQGWWREYRWAVGTPEERAEQVILAIGWNGPVVMGTWWWDGMWEADSDGLLHASGQRVGGHSYLYTAYDKDRDAVWTPNSWGGEGQGWITRQDLAWTLSDEGEAALPRLRRSTPT